MIQVSHGRFRGLAILAALLGCGCAASTSAEIPESGYVPAEVQLGSDHPVMSESYIDSLDRFASTVRVSASFPAPGKGTDARECSGVLLHPRLVLTAGHCVCFERKPAPPEASDTSIVDAST